MKSWGLFFVIIFLSTNIIFAQEEGAYDLGTIVVSASRIQQNIESIPENVTVYDQEDIEATPARDLTELLNYIPGVDAQRPSKFGQAASVSIQGSSSRHVKVMVDGIPFNHQASGQVNTSKIPIQQAGRVEIVKGGASSAWGSALGGVINVISKDIEDVEEPEISITSMVSEFDTNKQSIEYKAKYGKLYYYIFGSYMSTDGSGGSDFDAIEKKIYQKFVYPITDILKVVCSMGYSGADVASGIFDSGRWQRQPYYARYGQIRLIFEPDTDYYMETALKYNYQDIQTDFIFGGSNDPYWVVQTYDKYKGAEFKFVKELAEDKTLALGCDFDVNNLKSSYAANKPTLYCTAPYFSYIATGEKIEYKFGARFDDNSEFGSQFNPSAGVVYHMDDKSLVRANVSRAFNAPPLLWKYYTNALAGVATNPDIKPERAWVYEVGLETKPMENMTAKVSLYQADVKDAIAQTRNGAGDRIMENFQEFRRQGIEVDFTTTINSHLSFVLGMNLNEVVNKETDEKVDGNGVARTSYDIGFYYKNESGLNASLIGYYHRFNEPDAQSNDRRFIFDAKISKKFEKLIKNSDTTCFLNIYNIFDTDYWADYWYPLPGRHVEAGLTLEW